ncbi:unnamed protein product [Microthlaspi erraticum]|uniref:FBD domain-containing protein n=1 Tax=Microthlaspi erraticum TaxID=1685480 RepID=A0A6D2J5W1_9BRAS|nr:unnamed protein product [Microthlaspi erraticum]
MDRISGLSDDLLIKVLSYLPTKLAVSASILSKRWKCLWMWLPKLEFIGNSRSPSAECKRLRCFLHRNLPLYRAPVIESFVLKLYGARFKPEDISLCVLYACSRYLRELEISYMTDYSNVSPSSLYLCRSLVILKLEGNILFDVLGMVGLPSLKKLQLVQVKFLDRGSFGRLVSVCPVLEHLSVEFRGGFDDSMGMITVTIPSLQSLSLQIPSVGILDGLVIDTPSLTYLKLEDYRQLNHSCLIENMPKLVEAYVDVSFSDIESLIGSITSVKRLKLSSEAVYGGGYVFNELEKLKLCVGTRYASDLLVRLLQDSPKLRVLSLFEMDHKLSNMICWNQPKTVPKCVMSSLQVFNWSGYIGKPHDRDIAVYILKKACLLETATILYDDSYTSKYEMLRGLSFSSRASTTCKLVFDEFLY